LLLKSLRCERAGYRPSGLHSVGRLRRDSCPRGRRLSVHEDGWQDRRPL